MIVLSSTNAGQCSDSGFQDSILVSPGRQIIGRVTGTLAGAGTTTIFIDPKYTTQPGTFGPTTTAGLSASCPVGSVGYATDATAGANLYLCTTANTWTQLTSYTSNASNLSTGTVGIARIPTISQNFNSSPSNPTGTTSTTAVMMGIGSTVFFTPNRTGTIYMNISGDVTNTTTGDGSKSQIRYGTGTAPVNGAAASGTTCGDNINSSATGSHQMPQTLDCLIVGLTVSTTYWFDIGVAAITGGTVTIADLQAKIFELP